MADEALTAKQQAFVREYLMDRNASAACRRAGYAVTHADIQAAKLMAMPAIKAALAAGEEKLGKRATLTKDWLVENIRTSLVAAIEEKHHAGIGRLGELLAKLHGWTIETRNLRIIRSIEDLSDAELAALAGTEEDRHGTRH